MANIVYKLTGRERDMKNRSFVKRAFAVSKMVALTFIVGCPTAVIAAQSTEPASQSSDGLHFILDANGNILLKNSNGENVGEKCAIDPASENICSIFQSGSQLLADRPIALTIPSTRNPQNYTSSQNIEAKQAASASSTPQCYLIFVNGVAYVWPSAEYCRKP